jgi:hypothetical protein
MKTIILKSLLIGVFALLGFTAEAAITTEVLGGDWRQCVDYARSRMPSLPYGLYTLNDKRNIINASSCKAGSVAIIDVGNSIGHVAYVESCDSSGSSQSIVITETNWKAGYKTRRTAKTSKISNAQSELRIIGYRR